VEARSAPRREGIAATPVRPSLRAVQKVREHLLEAKAARDALAEEAGDAELVGRARRYSAGEAEPVGAAVMALIAGHQRRDASSVFKDFLDAWVLEHGLGFAACAVVEMDSIEVVQKSRVEGRSDGPWQGEWLGVTRWRRGTEVVPLESRVRALLAAAGDAEYAEAVERLAELRDTPRRRTVVAYLAPSEHDWVAGSCAEIDSVDWRDIRIFLMLRTPGHVAPLGTEALLLWDQATVGVLATLLDGLGPDALPVLTNPLSESFVDSAERRRVLEAIGLIPTDEAFGALLDRVREDHVRPALSGIMDRFPARTLRLLSGAAADLPTRSDTKTARVVTELLAGHVAGHPETVAAVERGVPQESRALIASLTKTPVRVPDAP
jgi:hypothetical protein